ETRQVQTIEIGTNDVQTQTLASPPTNDERANTVQSFPDILLHLPVPAEDARLDGPEARACAERLAAAALPLIDRLQPAVVVLVGGDTTFHALVQLGVQRLEVLRELLPGMPLAHGADAKGNERLFVLKAGNHGDETTLATLLQQMKNEA
ncbi:MAG TPA: nucleotide-binding domain containing protein, partial [Roseiflexaceae bacterium]|nr:nucleotide-binding domain containing protein [Roseiflexaceae bacterium]